MSEVDKSLVEQDYLNGMKYKDLAEKYGVSINTVKSWKQRYKWDRKSVHTKEKKVCTQKESADKPKPSPRILEELEVENEDLTDRQRLFCLYYVKSFNATMAAIKAGYAKESAHVRGAELVRNSKVREEIKRLKGLVQEEILVDAMDVINKYIKIAFSDITDFVTFGRREVPVIGMYGPVKDENGDMLMETVSYVDFKESSQVDGSIISEVKQGKDGISIKLVDKKAALDFLTKHFDLLPDSFKRRIEEEKLNLDKAKLLLDVEKAKGENKANQHVDALKKKMAERKMKNGSS